MMDLKLNAADRIGDLPEPIIANILSYLPTKDAFATSLLSKNWRLYWTGVATFDIEEPDDSETSVRGIQFSEFVKMVLHNLDDQSIQKFRVRLTIIHPLWTDVRIARRFTNLKVLDVASQSEMTVEECFTMETLEIMKLGGFFKVKLPSSVCLPKLADLELNSILTYESDDTLRKLISSCPVLQSLTIKRSSSRDNLTICTLSSLSLKRLHVSFSCAYQRLEAITPTGKLIIHAPSLEYLGLHDSISENISVLHGLSSVTEADLDIVSCNNLYAKDIGIWWDPDRFSSAHHSSTVGILETLHGVRTLKLSFNTMVAIEPTRKTLPLNYKRLTKLVVEYTDWQWDIVVDLMVRCVNLQVLEMHTYLTSGFVYWWYPFQYPRCLSLSLKQVTLGPEWDLHRVFGLFNFILNHGSAIQRVNLCFRENKPDDQELWKKILTIYKASPTCEIYTRIGNVGSCNLLGAW